MIQQQRLGFGIDIAWEKRKKHNNLNHSYIAGLKSYIDVAAKPQLFFSVNLCNPLRASVRFVFHNGATDNQQLCGMSRRSTYSSTTGNNPPFYQRAEAFKIPFFQRHSAFVPSVASNSTSSTSSFEDFSNTKDLQPNNSFVTMSLQSESSGFDFDEFVSVFKRNVSVKDRRWRLQTYKDCFVGAEAVQWMVTSGAASTREDAVKLGSLMQEAGLIEHCVRDHE